MKSASDCILCEEAGYNGQCTWPDNNGQKPCEKASVEKPPLGLMPKKLWDAQRMRDIYDAMERYAAAGKAVPLAWVQELRRIEVKPLDATDFEQT